MKFNIRKNDLIILTIAALFLGIFIAIQYSSKQENNSEVADNNVLAVEIEKIAKTNSELKIQVSDLTKKNLSIHEALNNQTELDQQITNELEELNIINGGRLLSGQGVSLEISSHISEAQLVDLINAIKNIGADGISINDTRVGLYRGFTLIEFSAPYKILIVGNGTILESALNRKGGIIDLLKQKSINVSVSRVESVSLPAAREIVLKYAKIKKE